MLVTGRAIPLRVRCREAEVLSKLGESNLRVMGAQNLNAAGDILYMPGHHQDFSTRTAPDFVYARDFIC